MARRTTIYGQRAETKRRQRQAQSIAGQRRAETLRCDDCGRGNALSRAVHRGVFVPQRQSLAAGSVKQKVVPRPGRGSTQSFPPCDSTMVRPVASPRPFEADGETWS